MLEQLTYQDLLGYRDFRLELEQIELELRETRLLLDTNFDYVTMADVTKG